MRTRPAGNRPFLCCIAAVLSLVMASACTQPNILLNGIGDTAYTRGETDQRVNSARQYFVEICRRTSSQCSERDWEDIVWTALNDIDERCGRYLSSLDSARRDKAYWNTTLTDVGVSTKAILGLANPGLKAIAIVEEAFDFGTSTVKDYYSSIILSEEPRVVERIVRKLQTQYRQQLGDKLGVNTIDGSGAHYAVRGYLRLCLPVTIEAELQSIKTNVEYTGRSGDRSTQVKETPVLKVLDALPVLGPKSGGSGGGGHGGGKPGQAEPDLAVLRDKLCLPPLPAGVALPGPDFTGAVAEFREARRRVSGGTLPTGKLTELEIGTITRLSTGQCSAVDQFQLTTFERFAFTAETQTGCPAKPQGTQIQRVACVHAMLSGALRKIAPNNSEAQPFLNDQFAMQVRIDANTRKAVRLFTQLCPVALATNAAPDKITLTVVRKLQSTLQLPAVGQCPQ